MLPPLYQFIAFAQTLHYKGKSSVAKGVMKPTRDYKPQICYTLLSNMQFE